MTDDDKHPFNDHNYLPNPDDGGQWVKEDRRTSIDYTVVNRGRNNLFLILTVPYDEDIHRDAYETDDIYRATCDVLQNQEELGHPEQIHDEFAGRMVAVPTTMIGVGDMSKLRNPPEPKKLRHTQEPEDNPRMKRQDDTDTQDESTDGQEPDRVHQLAEAIHKHRQRVRSYVAMFIVGFLFGIFVSYVFISA